MHRNKCVFTCIDERKLAAMLNLKPATLQKWRVEGRGPVFRRIGGAVRYRVEDVETWIASRPKGGEGL